MAVMSLLVLPPEIRNRIWDFVAQPCVLQLNSTSPEIVTHRPYYQSLNLINGMGKEPSHWLEISGLVFSCRQAYSEFYPLFFSRSTVQAKCIEDLHSFLHNIDPDKHALIHKLDLHVPIFYRHPGLRGNIKGYNFKSGQESLLEFMVKGLVNLESLTLTVVTDDYDADCLIEEEWLRGDQYLPLGDMFQPLQHVQGLKEAFAGVRLDLLYEDKARIWKRFSRRQIDMKLSDWESRLPFGYVREIIKESLIVIFTAAVPESLAR